MPPRNCIPQAVRHADLRRPVQADPRSVAVENGVPDIARTLADVDRWAGPAQQVSDHAPQVADGGGHATADVQRLAVASLSGADNGAGHVADVNEVPRLPPVAMDDGVLSGEEPADEGGDNGSLTLRGLNRTIEIGRAEDGVSDPGQPVKQGDIALGSQFGQTVRSDWDCRTVLADREPFGHAVHGCRGDEDDLAGARSCRGGHDIDRPVDVHRQVVSRIRHGVRDRHVRRQMDDDLGAGLSQQPVQRGANVRDDEPGFGGHILRPSRRHIVDHGDLAAMFKESGDHVESEKARSTGDQHTHDPTSRQPDAGSTKSQDLVLLFYAQLVRVRIQRGASADRFSSEGAAPLFRSESAWRFAIKRVFDVIASVALLVLFSVPMCLIALVVLLDDGSPVLFRQTRPGMNARLFTMYKFRTMGDASGPDGRPLPDVQRLTRAGRFLRTYSLDELPQLVNVLRGQMSLVGPRPLRVSYLPFYTERERIRFAVRPGMTGLAQVMGRNNLPWCDRLALDTQYVEKWSLALDLRILWQTAGRVIAHKGVQVIPGLALQPLDVERAGGIALEEPTCQ